MPPFSECKLHLHIKGISGEMSPFEGMEAASVNSSSPEGKPNGAFGSPKRLISLVPSVFKPNWSAPSWDAAPTLVQSVER